MLTLIIASIGHAAWDNILHWMVKEDPDASLIHMHGVRMFIVSIVLSIVNRFKAPRVNTTKKTIIKLEDERIKLIKNGMKVSM